MASVTLSAVTKRFGPSTVALEDVDLEVEDGEFLVLLGPSGCGKSTTLRLIAGLDHQDTGTISIDERCVDDVAAEDRDVAMVFQSYALYPHMSVRRNIAFSLRPRDLPRSERHQEVERVAEQLGLTALLARKPRELSGGEQQRVALARALVRRPRVFLMDEPLSNLDAQLRTQTRAELLQLHRDLGTTIVYVTHDQVEALTMADRVAVLGSGRLQQVGTPDDVYDRPANTFVAGFVGTPPMNLWPARVDQGVARIDGLAVSDAPRLTGAVDGIVVGVRPEAVRALPDDERAVGVAATVEWVEDLGHEHLVGGTLVGGSPFALRWAGEGSPPRHGAQLGLRPDRDALHWFDRTSGERIG
ncbi:MAG TPA: ABC transporter ATP-binding protein [Ilumatobacter sp.]|nr:ABC transporter ATP-binding protein [Ilumatobacter sp.]